VIFAQRPVRTRKGRPTIASKQAAREQVGMGLVGGRLRRQPGQAQEWGLGAHPRSQHKKGKQANAWRKWWDGDR